MRIFVVVAALLLPACSSVKYVPVEVKIVLPDEPPECRAREARPQMKPLPEKLDQFPSRCANIQDPAQCVNLAWARHEAGAVAVDRRNGNRHAICTKYLDALKNER